MIKAFFGNKKWALWAYGGLFTLIALLYLQVSITVHLNEWRGPFNDLLQQAATGNHTAQELWHQISLFIWIVLPYSFIAMATKYFSRVYGLRWREAITFNYLPKWRKVSEKIEGESQRIQEDAYLFAKIIESLGMQIAFALMTIFSFVPVLWGLSKQVDLQPVLAEIAKITGIDFPAIHNFPGSLVWVILIITGVAMTISWYVGIRLPGLQYNNQMVEAAFRKELVLAEDDKANFASMPTVTELFLGIRYNYHRLFMHYGYFDLWSSTYMQLMVVLPHIIVGPGLFVGAITLGTLMRTADAFDRVHSSFSVIIDNWTTVTELRSIWKRLSEFETAIDKYADKA